ncbi:MAG: hypothetical protein IJV98_03915 [Clostridia bacterium]|nr:hypothetical protein [Clostridia bacterium]
METQTTADSGSRIDAYRDVIEIMSQSTDDFLFIMDIKCDEIWFFGQIEKEYRFADGDGKSKSNTIA